MDEAMEKIPQIVKERLKHVPENPGVYLMKDKDGEIIYIGKALVLRNRVRSYFTGTPPDLKTRQLVGNIADLEYIVTSSETEALVLEANLVKKHRPRYNIDLKDDKKYPFIAVTLAEPFPRVFVTRDLLRDGTKYFGPYTDAGAVRRTLRHLAWVFPLRSCKRKIPADKIVWERACINYQLGKCPAPCIGKIDQDSYGEIIHQVIRFLQGHDGEVIEQLQRSMDTAAEKMEFEKAAKLRDRIRAIEKLRKNQNVWFADGRDRDVIGYYRDGSKAVIAVLKVLGGKLLNRETYEMANISEQTREAILAAFLQQYYSGYEESGGARGALPHQILIQFEPEEMDTLNTWLHGRLHIPQRGDNRKLLAIAKKNAFTLVEELKLMHLRKASRSILPVQELKDKLGLTTLPRRMACVDISTIQGTDTVSSLVYFENGKPRKKNYRRFIMKSVEGQDDFASMRETLQRYLRRIKEGEEPDPPDLIVIDGGKGQLSSAWAMLQESGVEGIEMISLAKRIEEVFTPGASDSVILPRTSIALRLLVQIRDEAHRFAVGFHRKRRSSRTLTSELDRIKGLGNEKKFLLLKEFGSVTGIRKAQLSELMRVPGIGEKTARLVKEGLGEG